MSFLVACQTKGLNPAGELRSLLNSAEEPSPPDGGTVKQDAALIDAMPAAVAFFGVVRTRQCTPVAILAGHFALLAARRTTAIPRRQRFAEDSLNFSTAVIGG